MVRKKIINNTEKKEKNSITISSLRRLVKNEGSNLVSKDALEFMQQKLTEKSIEIVKKAIQITKAEQRKRVSGEDIIIATRLLYS